MAPLIFVHPQSVHHMNLSTPTTLRRPAIRGQDHRFQNCSRTSRALDLVCSSIGLLILLPVLLVIAVVVRLVDGSPILFSQWRIGQFSRPFRIWKFRTMHQGAGGPGITASSDCRVSKLGTVLRRYKLDELPQLFNVLVGEMSLIGPRPEVPEFVDVTDPLWRQILSVRPGITDVVSLIYRDEEAILSNCNGSNLDPESYYRRILLPAKLELSVRQLSRRRGLLEDGRLILWTLYYSLFPGKISTQRVEKLFES